MEERICCLLKFDVLIIAKFSINVVLYLIYQFTCSGFIGRVAVSFEDILDSDSA